MTDRRFHYVMGGLTLALIVLAFLICGSALFDENFPSGLLKMRLARVLLGIVAGTSLSIAGVILQATLRNPLAEPYLIGVSSGGGLGASIAILLGLSAFGVWTLPLAAFCGSFCTVLIVLVLAGRLTAFSPATLLLGGVAVSSAAGGVLGILISLSNHETLRSISWWLMGGLQITDQSLLLVVTLVTLLALPFAFMLARDLDAMALGDSFAHALGVSLKRRRLGTDKADQATVGQRLTHQVDSGQTSTAVLRLQHAGQQFEILVRSRFTIMLER